jgi:hypothetical protein
LASQQTDQIDIFSHKVDISLENLYDFFVQICLENQTLENGKQKMA